jgi:hypothetical protein
MDTCDITAKVSKSTPDGFGNFLVTISGSLDGELFNWPLPGFYTASTWTEEVEKQKIFEFKRQVLTQF